MVSRRWSQLRVSFRASDVTRRRDRDGLINVVYIKMSGNIILRSATRPEISDLALIVNAANEQWALHRRIALHQEKFPSDYYLWRLNIIRQGFATSD